MKLPPLNALRCFEAAARLLSLKQAASELCVTASAASQQIARLEEALNTPLFIRTPRQLQLTEVGEIYLRAVQPAFLQIAAATQRLQVPAGPEKVTLSCTSGFAIQWLLPRLADFERRYPKIEIQIGTTNRRVDLLSEGIDFAVRHGVGGWPELQAYRLLDDDLIPVCSPQLIAPRRSLAGAGDLLQYPLLHDEHREDWALWCEAVGLEPDRARRGPVFTDSNGVTEAAFAGMGMALLRRSFIASALTQGRLVNPLAQPIACPLAYHLVYHETALLAPANRCFRDWLLGQRPAVVEEGAQ
ncbi:transcriptional regulator GcvA [Klebsiella variicola]|uniref:transcriptional regulator GcvA n=1 Tax=Klebsiella variicola TaxID=244366 RepID=UPI000E3C5EE0|nr:transcriptional regulator GcvA [Klebsiella variicola]